MSDADANAAADADEDADEGDSPLAWKQEVVCLGKLSWPISLSILSRLLMLTVDVACVGHLGVNELAGASMAAVWCQVVTSFMSGPAFILNTLCAQAWGAQNFALVGIWLQISMLTITLLTPIAVIAALFTGDVVNLFGAKGDVEEYARTFGNFSVLWIWPNLIYIAVRQYFQAQDIVKPAMLVNMCFVIVNLVLNIVFIWGIPGIFSGFGFRGSPMATGVSRWLQLLVFVIYVKMNRLHVKTWKGWKWSEICVRARLREFMSQAFPYMFINLLGSSWDQLTTLISAALGVQALAEQSSMGTLLGPLFSLPAGIGFAVQLRVGQHLGAQRWECAKNTWKCGFIVMTAVCVALGITFLAAAPVIGDIFSDDESVISTSRRLTPVLCLIFLFGSLGIVNFSALEGQARQKTAIVAAILGHGFTTVPFTFLLCFLLHWGLFGIWWGQFFGEVLCLALTALLVLRSDWKGLAIDAARRSEQHPHSPDDPSTPSSLTDVKSESHMSLQPLVEA